MNIFFWVLQVLLALHTIMGAVWKFTNPEQAVPSLKAIPHEVWLGISVFELFLSLCLILPAFNKKPGILAPIASLCIGAVMVPYTAVHFSSGAAFNGQVTYWLVVLAYCAFLAYGRLVLKRFQGKNL
jgi:hypothetical protein